MKHCWHHKTHVLDMKAGLNHLSHCCYCNRVCLPELVPDKEHGKFALLYDYQVPADVDAEKCPMRAEQEERR